MSNLESGNETMSETPKRPSAAFTSDSDTPPGVQIVYVSFDAGTEPGVVNYFIGLDDEFTEWMKQQPIEYRKKTTDRIVFMVKQTMQMQLGIEPQ